MYFDDPIFIIGSSLPTNAFASYSSRQEPYNKYLVASSGFDTAENVSSKVSQKVFGQLDRLSKYTHRKHQGHLYARSCLAS